LFTTSARASCGRRSRTGSPSSAAPVPLPFPGAGSRTRSLLDPFVPAASLPRFFRNQPRPDLFLRAPAHDRSVFARTRLADQSGQTEAVRGRPWSQPLVRASAEGCGPDRAIEALEEPHLLAQRGSGAARNV